jgi:hypothetical protein
VSIEKVNSKEKLLLVKLSKNLGIEPEESMLQEVMQREKLNSSIAESIRSNLVNDLLSAAESLKPSTQNIPYGNIPTAKEVEELLEEKVEPKAEPPASPTLIEKTSKIIRKQDSFQQPSSQPVDATISALVNKVKFLEKAIGKIAATGPGSGEVNLRYLDDVDRSSIADGLFMRYNATSKKFEFDEIDHLTSFSTINQSIANITLAQVVDLGNVEVTNNIELGANSTIIFSKTNTYNIVPSIQLYNVGNENFDFQLWLRKNNVDVEYTNSIFTVPAKKNTGTPGKLIATTPLPIRVNAGDSIQIMCHCDSTDVSIQTIPGSVSPPTPIAPGVILMVSRV